MADSSNNLVVDCDGVLADKANGGDFANMAIFTGSMPVGTKSGRTVWKGMT